MIDHFVLSNGDIEQYDYNGLVNKPFATPEMFGAKGDGVTDDTEAWQSALDNGRIIFCCPTSNYLITSVLRIKANTTIFMNNCTVTCNQKRWLFNFLDTDEFTDYNGNGNIRIVNGIVYGGSVSFWHGENISFEGVHFKNCLNDHFFELAANKNFTIEKCSFVGMRENTGSTHEYINIDPNGTEVSTYFTGRSYPSANYSGTRNEDIYIRDNFFNINEDDANFQAQDNPFGCHSPLGNYHKNVQFVGNTCLNFKGRAFRLSDFEETIIRGNYFRSEICEGTAIQMVAANGMTYANIDCIIENNYIGTYKWCASFNNSKNLVAKGNVYENFDLASHAFGTWGGGNTGFVCVDNIIKNNKSIDILTMDSGDYRTVETPPIDIMQMTRARTTVSGNTVTNTKMRWTHFNKLWFQFTNSPQRFEVDAWASNLFAAGYEYPIIQDPTTGNVLASFTIDTTDPSVMTIAWKNGATARTVQMVHVAKTLGTVPTT